jgi:Lon protease-like protein
MRTVERYETHIDEDIELEAWDEMSDTPVDLGELSPVETALLDALNELRRLVRADLLDIWGELKALQQYVDDHMHIT